MKILGSQDVRTALIDQETEITESVRNAYILHSQGRSSLPFSGFLRPPQPVGSRVISLPAYLGGPAPVMGLKWIASFPANVDRGLQRASSLCILNDLETGYPSAVLEGSQISATRTAAAAALASGLLRAGRPVRVAGLIGCGTINHRVMAYLALAHPEIETVVLRDAVPGRAEVFAAELAGEYPSITFKAGSVQDALRAETVCLATTDSSYWLDLSHYPDRPDGQVILHLSLRDLAASSVLAALNVVDDIGHVCREETSLHRAEQLVGHRDFIHAEIGALLRGEPAPEAAAGQSIVFSPFGLGVLDLAVCQVAIRAAQGAGLGTEAAGFDPGSHRVTSLTREAAV